MKKCILKREEISKQIYDNSYESLTRLVDNCYYSQITFQYSNSIDDLSFWREYCTVKMSSARQSGHSYALSKVAFEYFDNPLFISPNKDMKDRLRNTFSKASMECIKKSGNGCCVTIGNDGSSIMEFKIGSNPNVSKYTFLTASVNQDTLRGYECDAVLVDCAFMLSKKKIDAIYDTFGPSMSKCREKFFIFVE